MAAGRHAAAAAGPALVSSLLNPHLEMLMKKNTKKNVVFEEQAKEDSAPAQCRSKVAQISRSREAVV